MKPEKFITAALEASIVWSPRDHGLTREEIHEAGKRVGLRPGEIDDAIPRTGLVARVGQPRLRVEHLASNGLCSDFTRVVEPDVRDIASFEFIRVELHDMAREVGEAKARLPRDTLVARGEARGLKARDLEVAITVSVIDRILVEKDGVISHSPDRVKWLLPTEQAKQGEHLRHVPPIRAEALEVAIPIVRDIVARRDDGRSLAADPLDSFERLLSHLGHARFHAWWVQQRTELRLADPARQPVCALVIAASLAEAALAFVVPMAQQSGLMKRIELTKPRQWRFIDLVQGARSGNPNIRAIFDERTAQRGVELNDTRQRIHAGYLIEVTPTGPIPDLKPEQARDALHTLDLLVRKIVEWLDETGHGPQPPRVRIADT